MANGNDIAETIRSMIKNENDLINHRLTWMGTSQGLLLAALTFAWDKKGTCWVVTILYLLGTLVALSTFVATQRANQAIKKSEDWWKENKPNGYSGPEPTGVEIHKERTWFLMPGYCLPCLFYFGWIAIALIYFLRPIIQNN